MDQFLTWFLLAGDVAIAVVLLRLHRQALFPRAALAFSLFFGVRAVGRFLIRVVGLRTPDVLLAVDILTALALAWLVFEVVRAYRDARRQLRTSREQHDAAVDSQKRADAQTETYDRAVKNYVELAYHRLLNPVAAIKGAALTLQSDHIMNKNQDSLRQELCHMIVEQCERLERMTLDPTLVVSVEETNHHPLPPPSSQV